MYIFLIRHIEKRVIHSYYFKVDSLIPDYLQHFHRLKTIYLNQLVIYVFNAIMQVKRLDHFKQSVQEVSKDHFFLVLETFFQYYYTFMYFKLDCSS